MAPEKVVLYKICPGWIEDSDGRVDWSDSSITLLTGMYDVVDYVYDSPGVRDDLIVVAREKHVHVDPDFDAMVFVD